MRAVIQDGDRFLIAHTAGANNTYLPGGHLEAGEGMRQALAREIHEELGIRLEVGEYLGSVEHAWQADGASNHEINHCFTASSPELSAAGTPPSLEEHVEFYWHSVDDFEEFNLQPAPLRQLIEQAGVDAGRPWWGSTIETEDA